MTKLEYYLILIAARLSGDFILKCIRCYRHKKGKDTN